MGYKKQAGKKGDYIFVSAYGGFLHNRSGKGNQGKPPDQKSVYQVNNQIDQMVSPDIELVDIVICGEC